MSTRFDVTTPRKRKDGNTFWMRIGSAWPAKEGEGFNVELDALPLADAEGRCSFIIRPAKDLREASGTSARQAPAQSKGHDPLGDSIPFRFEDR
jgi:hypothetical protein